MNLSKEQAEDLLDVIPSIARAGLVNPIVFQGVWLKEIDGVIFWKSPEETQWKTTDELQRIANTI